MPDFMTALSSPAKTALRSACLALPVLVMATASFAAGGGDSSPPQPTETTKECKTGRIWDEQKKRCVKIKNSSLDADGLYQTLRELAYAGRLTGAGRALDAISDQSSSRVLTYRGFIARKSGDWPQAEAYYALALSADPDNVLARAYLGMGLAEMGELDAAGKQLREIRNRGGRETWPERALIMSIRSRGVASY